MTLALAVVVTAACSATSNPPAPQAPEPSTSRFGAPTIDNPRDLTGREQQPCRSLVGKQTLSRLGYADTGTPGRLLGRFPSCSWRGGAPERSIDVAVVLGEDLFVDTYRSRLLPIFRPVEIGGLPAVETMSEPTALTCTTTVGVADHQTLDVTSTIDELQGNRPVADPCAQGRRIVEAIVATLPPIPRR